jgi:asparagine synthase (glutamine-hydrolysing)
MPEFAACVRWGRGPGQPTADDDLTRAFRRHVQAHEIERAPGVVLLATKAGPAKGRHGVGAEIFVDQAAEMAVAVACRLDDRDGLTEELGARPDVSCAPLLLRAYQIWGDDFPNRLRGDFAGLIWDWRHRTLICFRDPLGVRPLFYAIDAEAAVIASDVELVLALAKRRGSIDDQTVIEHLTWSYRSTDRTFWDHVRRLHGGHVLVARARRTEIRRYWSLPATRAVPRTIEAVHDEFRQLFLQALERRIDNDAPILAHLSGGVDSSTIVCAADWLHRRSTIPTRPIRVISARYPGLECDESEYIDAVTQAITLPSESWDGRHGDFRDLDVPSTAGPGLRTHRADGSDGEFIIAEREGAGSILSGLGGDHIGAPFGVIEGRVQAQPGSFAWQTLRRPDLTMRQRAIRARMLVRSLLPDPLRTCVAEMRADVNAPSWLQRRWRSVAGKLGAAPTLRLRAPFSSLVQEARWQELTGARLALSLDADHRASSEHGVEMRYPFLDRDLVDFVLSLPPECWPSGDGHYRLHRLALADLLPAPIRLRTTKARFSHVIAYRVRQSRDRISRLIYDREWAAQRWVDRSRAQATFERAMSGAVVDTDLSVWQGIRAIANLEAWLRIVFGYDSPGWNSESRSRAMPSQDDRFEQEKSELTEPYVPPTLTLVGNMNDLLAAGGTQDADQGVCVAGGVEVDGSCN